jgi:hypothetical protein
MVAGGGWEVEGATDEGCHLAPRDGVPRAVTIVEWRVAASGDLLGGNSLDAALVGVAVIVGESATRRELCTRHEG